LEKISGFRNMLENSKKILLFGPFGGATVNKKIENFWAALESGF
jgi:hypothetical protein